MQHVVIEIVVGSVYHSKSIKVVPLLLMAMYVIWLYFYFHADF